DFLRDVAAGRAEVVVGGAEDVGLRFVLRDLGRRGVRRLLVEGGGSILTAFLVAGLGDEVQGSVAPFLRGGPQAPRSVGPGNFPHGKTDRMKLVNLERLGDVALLTFVPKKGDAGHAE